MEHATKVTVGKFSQVFFALIYKVTKCLDQDILIEQSTHTLIEKSMK